MCFFFSFRTSYQCSNHQIFFPNVSLWLIKHCMKLLGLCLHPENNFSICQCCDKLTIWQQFLNLTPFWISLLFPSNIAFFFWNSQSPPSSTHWVRHVTPAQKLSANMHAGGLSESQENFHEAQFVFAISSSTETQLTPAAVSQPQPRISDCFQAKRENLPFCLWGFFSGPFLPFSIVLGAASPGEASSNGEDYIAAIIEPSALPGHSSGLPSCCTFRGGAGPSVNSRLFFTSLFWRKDYFVLHFDRPSFTSPLCSSFWPPVWHKKKKKRRSLFSRRVAEISPAPD